MKTARGFTIIQLGLVLGILIALGAIVAGVRGYLVHIETEAKAAGRKAALLEVANRDNDKLLKANARIKQLEEVARGEEARRAVAVAGAVAQHVKEKNHVQAKLDTLRAGVRDGSVLLRDPGAEARGGCPGNGERGGTALAADPAGDPGRGGGGELPRQGAAVLSSRAAEFILAEAARADAVIGKLRLCRNTLKAERTSPPG